MNREDNRQRRVPGRWLAWGRLEAYLPECAPFTPRYHVFNRVKRKVRAGVLVSAAQQDLKAHVSSEQVSCPPSQTTLLQEKSSGWQAQEDFRALVSIGHVGGPPLPISTPSYPVKTPVY